MESGNIISYNSIIVILVLRNPLPVSLHLLNTPDVLSLLGDAEVSCDAGQS